MRPVRSHGAILALALACAGALLQGCATTRGSALLKADDGARLYLDIRGRSDAAAIILYLHGGPGSWLEGLLGFEAYPGPLLERDHLVVYLHQRGLMKSPPVDTSLQTIAAHVADVDRVAHYLDKQYPGKRLILLGHSWGGVLALAYAGRHPESPVDALVAVSTPISMIRNEAAGYEAALNWARTNNRPRAAARLQALGPPPYDSLETMLAQRRWTRRALNFESSPISLSKALDAGEFRAVDLAWSAEGNRIAHALFTELMAVDLRPELPRIRLPLLAIAGGQDDVVMTSVTLEDLGGYGGPKQVKVFENAGHTLYIEQPEYFAVEVTRFIRGTAPGGN